MRKFSMLQTGKCVSSTLPGFEANVSRSPWPVWSGSTRARVKFQPMTRKTAARLLDQLHDFEGQTRQPNRQDGAIGRNGLAIARVLLFRFLNWRTGQLDPSYDAIARAAHISVRSVARGLQALKQAGVLNWLRRCVERTDKDGRFCLEQDSNAYAVCPPSHWNGFKAPPQAPLPDPGTWGDHPCGMRDALIEALAEGPDAPMLAQVQQLETDPGNPLAAALARLGRALEGSKLLDLPGVPA